MDNKKLQLVTEMTRRTMSPSLVAQYMYLCKCCPLPVNEVYKPSLEDLVLIDILEYIVESDVLSLADALMTIKAFARPLNALAKEAIEAAVGDKETIASYILSVIDGIYTSVCPNDLPDNSAYLIVTHGEMCSGPPSAVDVRSIDIASYSTGLVTTIRGRLDDVR